MNAMIFLRKLGMMAKCSWECVKHLALRTVCMCLPFPMRKNAELFGKCNNPRGHGHRYVAEATIGGEYDERSGALANFEELRDALGRALAPWRDKHLDLETDEFRDQPSTGENIVRALWPRLDGALQQRLLRLRLWETANNRFTLRRV